MLNVCVDGGGGGGAEEGEIICAQCLTPCQVWKQSWVQKLEKDVLTQWDSHCRHCQMKCCKVITLYNSHDNAATFASKFALKKKKKKGEKKKATGTTVHWSHPCGIHYSNRLGIQGGSRCQYRSVRLRTICL